MSILLDSSRRTEITDPDDRQFTVAGVPCIHAVTDGFRGLEETVAAVRSTTSAGRQGFLRVFLVNWHWGLKEVDTLARQLGPDYVPVDAEILGRLYLQSAQRSEK